MKNDIKPYVNIIKNKEEFKQELNNRINELNIGESFDISINGVIKTLTKTDDKKICVTTKELNYEI